MGVGSVVGAAFIIPRLRARYSPNTLIIFANLLVVLVYLLMAVVRQKELFLVVGALAGIGWTLSASELWVAAQRAMPGWARGRMNATVIMVSQGALAIGGVIWGSAVCTTGWLPRCSLTRRTISFFIATGCNRSLGPWTWPSL
jgi:hypothetical protein